MMVALRHRHDSEEDRASGPFRHSEFRQVATLIGLTSILIGLLTFGYVEPIGLPAPKAWGIGHVAAGVAAIVSMRYRVKGYATAGALLSGLAVMRAGALGFIVLRRGDLDAHDLRDGVGIVLWIAFAGSTWWIWSRVLARHVAWNRLAETT